MFVGEGGGEFVFFWGGAGRGCLHTTTTQTKKTTDLHQSFIELTF